MQINELEEMGIWVVWNTLESFSWNYKEFW